MKVPLCTPVTVTLRRLQKRIQFLEYDLYKIQVQWYIDKHNFKLIDFIERDHHRSVRRLMRFMLTPWNK